jgi:hypothetical protein
MNRHYIEVITRKRGGWLIAVRNGPGGVAVWARSARTIKEVRRLLTEAAKVRRKGNQS